MSFISFIKNRLSNRNKESEKVREICKDEEFEDPVPQLLHFMTPVINREPSVFKKHIVCFLDVFNYESSLIANNYTDSVELLSKEIRSLIRNISNNTRILHLEKEDGAEEENRIELKSCITPMFNGVVISYDLSNRREDLIDIYMIFTEISIVIAELARSGYFAYGGLAYGDLCQNNYSCSGEAIERALYCSRNSGYPRIVIDGCLFMEDSSNSLISGIDYNKRNLMIIEELFHCVDVSEVPAEQLNVNLRRNPNFFHFLDFMEFSFSHNPELIKIVKGYIEKGISKSYGDEKDIFISYARFFNSIVYNTLVHEISECININFSEE